MCDISAVLLPALEFTPSCATFAATLAAGSFRRAHSGLGLTFSEQTNAGTAQVSVSEVFAFVGAHKLKKYDCWS